MTQEGVGISLTLAGLLCGFQPLRIALLLGMQGVDSSRNSWQLAIDSFDCFGNAPNQKGSKNVNNTDEKLFGGSHTVHIIKRMKLLNVKTKWCWWIPIPEWCPELWRWKDEHHTTWILGNTEWWWVRSIPSCGKKTHLRRDMFFFVIFPTGSKSWCPAKGSSFLGSMDSLPT